MLNWSKLEENTAARECRRLRSFIAWESKDTYSYGRIIRMEVLAGSSWVKLLESASRLVKRPHGSLIHEHCQIIGSGLVQSEYKNGGRWQTASRDYFREIAYLTEIGLQDQEYC